MSAGGPPPTSTRAGCWAGYTGTIIRDGYAGYAHLVDALHAWCGAHGLRDLRAVWAADPVGQAWAQAMADLLVYANRAASAARAGGTAAIDEATLARIVAWYRGAVAKGIADNQRRRTQAGTPPARRSPASNGGAGCGLWWRPPARRLPYTRPSGHGCRWARPRRAAAWSSCAT